MVIIRGVMDHLFGHNSLRLRKTCVIADKVKKLNEEER